MKKIVVVIMLVLILALSGCVSDEDFYTKEEVDLLLKNHESEILVHQEDILEFESYVQEILDLLYASYVEYDEFDNMLYSGCEIIEGIKHCNIIFDLNKNYVEESYLWANFYDSFSEDLIEYIDESLEIEDDTIETTIAYTTLSMIDILLFMYNEELESGTIFTEEEIVYYDMLIIMRELYINELENGDE